MFINLSHLSQDTVPFFETLEISWFQELHLPARRYPFLEVAMHFGHSDIGRSEISSDLKQVAAAAGARLLP